MLDLSVNWLTLELINQRRELMNTQRPSVSKETILKASKVIAVNVNGDAHEIASCYYPHIDGYELAKNLENNYSWDISVNMIEDLDQIQWEVDSIHKQVCTQWVIDDDIKPPFDNGVKIKEGVIKGVYRHGAAMFMVTKYGETMEGRHQIIKFEDAVEA